MIDVQIKDQTIVELDLSGEVTGKDYESIRPELEKVFIKNGRQKFLFDMTAVDKFTPMAIFQDLKFDIQHLKFIGTTAVVSTKAMAETMTKIVDMLYPVKIEHFEDKKSALNWLESQEA